MALCAVSGSVKDPSETAISGAVIKANIVTSFFVSTDQIVPKEISTTSSSLGAWTLNLSQAHSYLISIEFPPNTTDSSKKLSYSITTPATPTANFSALATEL